jgi:hypothetical protein
VGAPLEALRVELVQSSVPRGTRREPVVKAILRI